MWWRQHWISPWPLVAKVIVTATVSCHTTTWSVKLRRAVLKVIFGKTVPCTPSHCGFIYHIVHCTVHRIEYFLKCDEKKIKQGFILDREKKNPKQKQKKKNCKYLKLRMDNSPDVKYWSIMLVFNLNNVISLICSRF